MSKVKFNGFSQEDINKVNKKSGGDVRVFASRGLRRVGAETESKPTATKPRSNLKASSAVSVPVNKQKNEVKPIEEKTANDTTLDELIDMDESMSTSLEEAMFYKPRSKRKPEKRDDSDDDEKVEEVSIVRGVSLKDFQSHQKLMQEQNKQKKDLLYKAIEQHTQKTAAEWKKMEEIKFELSKLDSELASDVAILRKQIDLACINYSNIEKQYSRIESQFLRAKVDLHNASEKKELLTEHLCTVISHNEDRKAKKLTELMEKVGISPNGEYHQDESVSSSVSIDDSQS